MSKSLKLIKKLTIFYFIIIKNFAEEYGFRHDE